MNTPSIPPLSLDEHICYAVYSAGMAIQRVYKPLLDELGLTYPQYLVLNVLWHEDRQTVGGIADRLALESSTLTPMLKRLESNGLVTRSRNPRNERQVVIALTDQGLAMQSRVRCLGEALFAAADHSPEDLAALNRQIRRLRDAIYSHTGQWKVAGDNDA